MTCRYCVTDKGDCALCADTHPDIPGGMKDDLLLIEEEVLCKMRHPASNYGKNAKVRRLFRRPS
jgi:hypothetical protein